MKLLCATDLLPKTEHAIERAGFLSEALGANLTLLHAVPPDGADGRSLEQRLRHTGARLATRTAAPAWRWESHADIAVQCGRPARVVLDTAARQDARLVILGPHRADEFADAVNGTITERVLGAATCPVLIAQQEMHGEYRHVLIALDGAPRSAQVLREVETLALTQDSFATVLHAHEPLYEGMMNTVGVGAESIVGFAAASRDQALANIKAMIAANSADAYRYQISIVESRPATAIRRAVETLKPDLVVLGTRGHGRFRRALLGSVASEVLRAVQCDVLLVPDRGTRGFRENHYGERLAS
jgi:nucleotide-binding universal stress UspA family protein